MWKLKNDEIHYSLADTVDGHGRLLVFDAIHLAHRRPWPGQADWSMINKAVRKTGSDRAVVNPDRK